MENITSKLGGGSSTNKNTGGQNEDYLDKGLDAAEKKYGGSLGQDPQKNRATNEKIVRLFPIQPAFFATNEY